MGCGRGKFTTEQPDTLQDPLHSKPSWCEQVAVQKDAAKAEALIRSLLEENAQLHLQIARQTENFEDEQSEPVRGKRLEQQDSERELRRSDQLPDLPSPQDSERELRRSDQLPDLPSPQDSDQDFRPLDAGSDEPQVPEADDLDHHRGYEWWLLKEAPSASGTVPPISPVVAPRVRFRENTEALEELPDSAADIVAGAGGLEVTPQADDEKAPLPLPRLLGRPTTAQDRSTEKIPVVPWAGPLVVSQALTASQPAGSNAVLTCMGFRKREGFSNLAECAGLSRNK